MKFKVSIEGRGKRGREMGSGGAGGGLGFGAADGIVRHAALDDDDDDGAINCGRSRSRSTHYDHATHQRDGGRKI